MSEQIIDRSSERVQKLSAVLMNESEPLAKRFRVIFSLKTIATPDAIAALGEGIVIRASNDSIFHHVLNTFLQRLLKMSRHSCVMR